MVCTLADMYDNNSCQLCFVTQRHILTGSCTKKNTSLRHDLGAKYIAALGCALSSLYMYVPSFNIFLFLVVITGTLSS